MQDKLDAKLQASFETAKADRNGIEAFKKVAKRNPAAAAANVSKGIPLAMQRVHTQARELYGVDIAREGWKEQFKQKQHSDVEAGLLLMTANNYLVYSRCQAKLDAYAADKSLSDEERAAKICEVGVEALRGQEAVLLHNLQEEQYRTSGEAARFVNDTLATRLAGQLATRISVRKNKSLAKGLDEIREHNKPARREQFEALLRELYALAPESWADHHVTDWQLEETRSAVVHKIERRQTPRVQEVELATFAARDALLKRGRDAGLPPREYELFRLALGDPKRFLRNGKLNYSEAACELGVAIGTIKSLWSRIRKTLAA
jgi:hypothetical protein